MIDKLEFCTWETLGANGKDSYVLYRYLPVTRFKDLSRNFYFINNRYERLTMYILAMSTSQYPRTTKIFKLSVQRKKYHIKQRLYFNIGILIFPF